MSSKALNSKALNKVEPSYAGKSSEVGYYSFTPLSCVPRKDPIPDICPYTSECRCYDDCVQEINYSASIETETNEWIKQTCYGNYTGCELFSEMFYDKLVKEIAKYHSYDNLVQNIASNVIEKIIGGLEKIIGVKNAKPT